MTYLSRHSTNQMYVKNIYVRLAFTDVTFHSEFLEPHWKFPVSRGKRCPKEKVGDSTCSYVYLTRHLHNAVLEINLSNI